MSDTFKRITNTAGNTLSLVELACAAGVVLVAAALAARTVFGWLAAG